MRFTTLRVVPEGVLFFEHHLRRLAPEGAAAGRAFARFAAAAAPGVYRVVADGAALSATRRGPSTLADGVPSRLAISPFAAASGPFPKPPPGGPYDSVRTPGHATLLTTAEGDELLEEASAAIVCLQGGRLCAVPLDRPRVASVGEAALDETFAFERWPLPVAASTPIALLNAVVGACAPTVPGRPPFPPDALRRLRAAVARTARRR